MLKVCTNCAAEYFARWRNEPVTLCVECRADVVLCAACEAIVRAPIDAAQLTLWPMGSARSPRPSEPHFSHGVSATQAQKRRSPYH
jgi:hypothetical protein